MTLRTSCQRSISEVSRKLSPGPNGLASRCKSTQVCKTGFAYGLAKGGQTDGQVGSQVAKSRQFHAYHWLMHFYNNRLLAINLCRLALGGQTEKILRLLGGQTVKILRLLASKFELDQSQRTKSTQMGGQTKRKSKTCVDLRVRLDRALEILMNEQGTIWTIYIETARNLLFAKFIPFANRNSVLKVISI